SSRDTKVAAWESVKSLPIKGSIEETVFASRAPIILESDSFDKEKYPVEAPVLDLGINTMMSLPLTQRGTIIGSLTFSSEKLHAFTPRDVETAQELASLIAGAVANAVLFERVSATEQQLQVVNAGLTTANKELEAFSYTVSHDLRAPLRAVIGFVKLLERLQGDKMSKDEKHYMDMIRGGAEQMNALLDDLLAFSRMSRAEPRPQIVDANLLLQEVMEDLVPAREGRQIEFKLANLPKCNGDPTLLRQVFQNLVDNGIKYTKKREQAMVEVGSFRKDEEPGFVTYFVKDNGAGFNMAYADKLFGVFQRLHRDTDFPGTGVGLAIVHRIVTRHGGKVWAEAEENKGAAIYFTLKEATEA
ncbi:MAG: GAF domain-containing protein, partial [Verrucomicrobia bacterium]|nr:GAF domain-containing protein [Verrucomicrobiota bacterium]